MKNTESRRGGVLRSLRRPALMAGLFGLTLSACDLGGLLEVTDPEFASPESMANPDALPVLVAGALGDFQVAYSGAGGDAYLTSVAIFTDEFFSSGSFPTRTAMDRRDLFPVAQGNTSDGAFSSLQRARRALKDAAESVVRVTNDPKDARVAELRGLEGYTYVALGEAFCSNIPFSNVENGERVAGNPLQTAQVFAEAIARFDQALAINANHRLAAIGKARALLNSGDLQAAAQAVASVPTEYVYFIEHSANSGRQNNPVYALQANGRYSVSDREGDNGLPFRSANDPRLPWTHAGDGFSAGIPLYLNHRYSDYGSNVPLATGIEARLIEAEAALKSGDTATWLSKLNALRAEVGPLMSRLVLNYDKFVADPTLEPLTDPGSDAARVDLHFQERAFWLYNTGTRLGDMRRLVRQYGRDPETVYPVGDYFKGGSFGTDIVLPVPFDEANNPNYDLAGCVLTQA